MNEFLTYLNNSIETANQKERELIITERKDEANLQKIRSNIFGICLTVVQVVAKEKSGKELWEDYGKRLDNISGNWVKSYEKAKLHNDVEKILIEETKFQVMKEVKEKIEVNLC